MTGKHGDRPAPPVGNTRWRRADERLTRLILIIGFGVAALVVLALFAGDFDWPRRSPHPGPPAPRPSRTMARVADFGTAIVLEDSFGCRLKVKPVDARWIATPAWAHTVTDPRVLAVRLTFVNRGRATIRGNPRTSCWLVDGGGAEWLAETARIGDQVDTLELPAGERCTGWFCFALPRRQKLDALVYQPSSTAGDDYAVWSMK